MRAPIRINGMDLDSWIENEGHPGDEIMNALEAAIGRMKESPGDVNEELTLVIVNDFEDEESEDDESEDEKSDLDKTETKE
jgi:hypothetical protein